MDLEYGDITSAEALAFCLADPAKARADTLALTQVWRDLRLICSAPTPRLHNATLDYLA